MDKELKKSIKKLLLVDSLLTSSSSITKILNELEDELEEIFGESKKIYKNEDLNKHKTLK